MGFRSTAGKDDGASDPDHRYVEELHDDDYGEHWLRIQWEGDGYEDAWIMARDEDKEYLHDNE